MNLINFLKSDAPNKVEPTINSQNMIIEKIHQEFYSEVDEILRQAKIFLPENTDKQHLIDKCGRLKKLGFGNSNEVKLAEMEIKRLDEIKIQNKAKSDLVKSVNYFTQKYPMYKFITEESVKKICGKYNLIYGEVGRYIGNVPDANLKHIEDFKIDENDVCHFYVERDIHERSSDEMTKQPKSKAQVDAYYESKKQNTNYGMEYFGSLNRIIEIYGKCELEIVAPLKDFNMTAAEIKNFKISNIIIPDPIVLCPVFHGGNKHYLIVTAWGIEASDASVVNHKMN